MVTKAFNIKLYVVCESLITVKSVIKSSHIISIPAMPEGERKAYLYKGDCKVGMSCGDLLHRPLAGGSHDDSGDVTGR